MKMFALEVIFLEDCRILLTHAICSNICNYLFFRNSILQNLFNTPKFKDFFLDFKYKT